jgi:hypothetical protein
LSDDEIAFQASSDVDISEQSESDSGPEEERLIQRCAFHSENIVM